MRARTLALGVGMASAAAGTAWVFAVRPWSRTWGVDPAEAAGVLPGDDLVADAGVVDTRGVEIGVPPEGVWPWLVQMGFGRAGWYSYDAIDMKGASANRIVPELQQLAVGDLVPTSPESGFVVRALAPGQSLVLYVDAAIVEEQAAAARARAAEGAGGGATPATLKVAGRLMPSMPGFAASWAFELRPIDEGRRTRLVERVRARVPASGVPAAVMGGAVDVGVFLMTRRQMLGIRDRAESALAVAGISAEFAARPDA